MQEKRETPPKKNIHLKKKIKCRLTFNFILPNNFEVSFFIPIKVVFIKYFKPISFDCNEVTVFIFAMTQYKLSSSKDNQIKICTHKSTVLILTALSAGLRIH